MIDDSMAAPAIVLKGALVPSQKLRSHFSFENFLHFPKNYPRYGLLNTQTLVTGCCFLHSFTVAPEGGFRKTGKPRLSEEMVYLRRSLVWSFLSLTTKGPSSYAHVIELNCCCCCRSTAVLVAALSIQAKSETR